MLADTAGPQAPLPADRMQFNGRRQPSDFIAAAFFALLGAACLWLAFRSWDSGASVAASVMAILGSALKFAAYSLVRRGMDVAPVLRMSRSAMKAKGMSDPLAWDEIDDAVYDEAHSRVLLRLREPRRPGFKATVTVPLDRLARAERRRAAEELLLRVNARRAALGRGESPHAREVREAREFAERLDSLTPRPWVLYAVIGLNVAVWLAQVASGVPIIKPTPEVLYRWGGLSASAVLFEGEWWRLGTAAFLHGGLVHLGMNMAILSDSGRHLSRLLGNWQVLLVYAASALWGSVASLHWSAQSAVSVGASGAVFGILGATIACVLMHRAQLPQTVATALKRSSLGIVGYSLVLGFVVPGVDNAAHIGGLLCGMLFGVLLVPRLQVRKSASPWSMATLAATIAAFAIWLFAMAVPVPRTWHKQLFATAAVLREVGTSLDTLVKEAESTKNTPVGDPRRVAYIENQVFPRCAAIIRSIDTIELPAWEPASQGAKLLKRRCEIQVRRGEVELEALRTQDWTAALTQMQALARQLENVDEEMKKLQERTAPKTRKQG